MHIESHIGFVAIVTDIKENTAFLPHKALALCLYWRGVGRSWLRWTLRQSASEPKSPELTLYLHIYIKILLKSYIESSLSVRRTLINMLIWQKRDKVGRVAVDSTNYCHCPSKQELCYQGSLLSKY